jgi:hypothetical protein
MSAGITSFMSQYHQHILIGTLTFLGRHLGSQEVEDSDLPFHNDSSLITCLLQSITVTSTAAGITSA